MTLPSRDADGRFYQVRRAFFWLWYLAGQPLSFKLQDIGRGHTQLTLTFGLSNTTWRERLRWIRLYQKTCSYCGDPFDWGYAKRGSWAEGKTWCCGCRDIETTNPRTT